MLDVKVQGTEASLLYIVYLYAVVLSGLYLQLLLRVLYAVSCAPAVNQCVAVHQQTQLVIDADSKGDRLVAGGFEGAVQTC